MTSQELYHESSRVLESVLEYVEKGLPPCFGFCDDNQEYQDIDKKERSNSINKKILTKKEQQ